MKNDITGNFITIQGWMVMELKLKGNDLLLFALIYGFCQDGHSEFKGSLNYMCKWLNCSRPTVTKAIDNLVGKNLIEKTTETINNVRFNRYKTSLQVVKKLYRGSKETLQGGSKETLQGGSKETLQGGSKETLPNIDTIDIDSLDIDSLDIDNDTNKTPLLEKEGKKPSGNAIEEVEFEEVGDLNNPSEKKEKKEKKGPQKEKIDFEYLKDFFNTHSGSLSKIQVLTETRKKRLESLEKQFGVQKLEAVVLLAGASDFLQGKNDRGWKADFDWVMKPQNFVKILEGNYSNKTPHKEEKEAMIGRQTITELADGLVMAKDAITDLMKNYGV